MTTEAQKKATERYQKANIKRYVLKVNKSTEKDLIDFLDGLKPFNSEMKKIIREQMK